MSWPTAEWSGRRRVARWRLKDLWGAFGGPSVAPRLSVLGKLILDAFGSPINLLGTNQGTWAEDNSVDAPEIAHLGANTVRIVGLRWWGGYAAGIDAYDPDPTNYYIKPTHRALALQVVDWARAAGLQVIFTFDSDYGAGAGEGRGMRSGQPNFWETAEGLEMREKFRIARRSLIRDLRTRSNIAMYELLAEPMPNGSNAGDAEALRTYYREAIADARIEDKVTPFMIGPRASYNAGLLPEVHLAERTDVIYTPDMLDGKTEDEDTFVAWVEGLASFRDTYNAPVLVNQLGRETGHDEGQGTTTDNQGLTAFCGSMFVLRAYGIHFTHWQWHQNTINPAQYAAWHKIVSGSSAPNNWQPKPRELAALEYHWRLSGASLQAAAHAAATAAGVELFYPKDDLSNVFQDAAGTVPVTAVGQPIGRINAVVGSRFVSQSTAGQRPTLGQGVNGYTVVFNAAASTYLALDQTYFASGDDCYVSFAGRPNAGNSNRFMWHTGNSSGTARAPALLVIASDEVSASWRGDDNVDESSQTITKCDGRAIVASAIREGDNKWNNLQGVQEGTTNTDTPGSIASLTRSRWGASAAGTGSNPFDGSCSLLALGKGVSAEHRRHIARLGAWRAGAPFRGQIPANTWASARRLGMNAPILSDWDKSQPFVDLVATCRGFRPYGTPYGEGTAAALKANGQPAEDFSVILLDNGVAADVGTYQCGFSGTGTPQGLDVTINNVVTADGVTTFDIVRGAFPGDGSDPRITIRVQNISADFGDEVPFYVLRPGVTRGSGQVWGTAWEAHLQMCSWFRIMNWAKINGSTEVGPDGALAWNNIPWEFGARLSTHIALANRRMQPVWLNVPAMSNAAYRTQYITQAHAGIHSSLPVLVEYSNETWNTDFVAYSQNMAATKSATQARVGAAEIVSITRASGVITVVLTAPHGKTVGQQAGIGGVRSNANGAWVGEVGTLISGTTGSTLKWNSATGGSDTADLDNAATIYLNPTHELCAPTSTLGVPDIFQAKENYDLVQCRDLYDRMATAKALGRMRPALGLKLADVDRIARMMRWCVDRYGSANWMTWCPAYYALPADQASLTTEQAVKDALDADRLVILKRLWQFAVTCHTYSVTNFALYEMGPHNDTKTSATQAAVAAVHASDWMRLFAKQLYQDVANVLKCVAMWFEAGAVDTYGTTVNNTWPVVSPHISAYATSAKWKAADETAASTYAPVAVSGYTWGTINCSDAISWVPTRAAGNLIIPTNEVLPTGGLKFPIQVDTAGAKTLTVNCCGNFGGDVVDILVDGVAVATAVALPDQNPYAEAANQAWTGSAGTLTAGEHTVTLRFAATRGAQIGLRTIVLA